MPSRDAVRVALYLSAAALDWSASVIPALQWAHDCWADGDDHLPFLLIHDLGHLIRLGPDFRPSSSRDLAEWPADERQARLRYQDRLIGQWLVDVSVQDAHLAISGLPKETQNAAVVHGIRLALSQRVPMANFGNAAHLRGQPEKVAGVIPGSFKNWSIESPDPEQIKAAIETMNTLLDAFPSGRLFDEDALWELSHHNILPSASARLTLRELRAATARVPTVPHGSIPTLRRRAQEVPIEDNESSIFPAGGFDAISQRGRFENLVRSEIAYVGERVGQGIDLFDLRFAMGELLYYTRDESPMLDARRHVRVVIDRPAELRRKHRDLPTQTLVEIQGMLLALRRDLVDVIGPHAATLEWIYCARSLDDQAVAAEDQALIKLILAAPIAHQKVTIQTMDSMDTGYRALQIVFSPRPPVRLPIGRQIWIRLIEPRCTVFQAKNQLDFQLCNAERALANYLLMACVG